MSVEKIVRPFQRGEVFTPRSLPPNSPAPVTDDTAHIEVIGSADSHYTTAPEPQELKFDVEWNEDPEQRKTTTVRLLNPDDHDQFVDMERIDQMVIQNNKTREKIKIKPNWRT